MKITMEMRNAIIADIEKERKAVDAAFETMKEVILREAEELEAYGFESKEIFIISTLRNKAYAQIDLIVQKAYKLRKYLRAFDNIARF